MKKIAIFGTFDGVHEGHKSLCAQAKKHGDHLVAVVARDDTVEQVKGKPPKHPQHQRLLDVYAIPEVDEVILGTNKKNKAEIVLDIKPDVICLGYDQTHFVDKLHELIQAHKLKIDVHVMKPFEPETYKSSLLNK